LADNSNKSGIYRWVNKISKNTYVGSAVDLSNRLNRYYHKSELKKKSARPINQALLKYGHSNFSLEILEYCSKDNLMERENYYLDKLKPEYNILKFAYSMLGYKHTASSIEKLKLKKVSPEHRLLLSLTHKNKIVSDETRAKLSAAIADFRRKNPLSEEKLANLRKKSIEREGIQVSVLNSQTNEVKEFTNKTEAGKFLGVTRQAITNSIIRNAPIKGIYHISKKD
jgi:group I intron endonuclease